MAVPGFQDFMLPLLQLCGDGHEHTRSELSEFIAKQFALTESDTQKLLASGKQTKFINRLA